MREAGQSFVLVREQISIWEQTFTYLKRRDPLGKVIQKSILDGVEAHSLNANLSVVCKRILDVVSRRNPSIQKRLRSDSVHYHSLLVLATPKGVSWAVTCPTCRLFAQVDFRREMRPIAFVHPAAFPLLIRPDLPEHYFGTIPGASFRFG